MATAMYKLKLGVALAAVAVPSLFGAFVASPLVGSAEAATKKHVAARSAPIINRVVFEKNKKVTYQGQRGAKEGGITHEEAPIDVSNVQLADPDDDKKPVRVGYRFDEDGTKIRVARPSGKDI